jgi:hypothetical protein
MGYRQYTDCVEPSNFFDLGFTYLFLTGLIATISTGLIVAAGTVGASIPILAALIALVTVLITFLLWWLYGRLVCLGGERCLIGKVLGRPSVKPTAKAGDDDASINVLLPPGPSQLGQLPLTLYQDAEPQGELVKPQGLIYNMGQGRSYVSDEDHYRYVSGLHCEFEGSGIRNLLIWAGVILALLIALLLATVLLPWLTPIILWLLVSFSVFAGTTALLDPLNPGDPEDIDPNLGTLKKGDLVVIKGDWVYDSLHDGWNEIHAIHACQRIGEIDPTADWPPELSTTAAVEPLLKEWCESIAEAEDAEAGGSRDDPANQWEVHPIIDGCKPPVIVE